MSISNTDGNVVYLSFKFINRQGQFLAIIEVISDEVNITFKGMLNPVSTMQGYTVTSDNRTAVIPGIGTYYISGFTPFYRQYSTVDVSYSEGTSSVQLAPLKYISISVKVYNIFNTTQVVPQTTAAGIIEQTLYTTIIQIRI